MISQASNCLPLKSPFDWHFSFSTMPLKIITRNSNFWSVLSTAKPQGVVNAKNFATRSVQGVGDRIGPKRKRRRN